MNFQIPWDSISKLDMSLTDGSELKGAFMQDETLSKGGSPYAITVNELK